MIVLLVVGNGRLEYFHDTVKSTRDYLGNVDAKVMVDDSGSQEVAGELRAFYPGWHHVTHEENRGMAAAVNSGWQAALELDADYVLHIEEDMKLVSEVPLTRACQIVDQDDIAQVLFRRQPISPEEQASGCVLATLCANSNHVSEEHDYTTYDALFSLNPCVIPRRVLEMGWPAGPIGVGNETGQTNKLLAAGYKFAAWGHAHDGQVMVEHIGHTRAEAWQL